MRKKYFIPSSEAVLSVVENINCKSSLSASEVVPSIGISSSVSQPIMMDASHSKLAPSLVSKALSDIQIAVEPLNTTTPLGILPSNRIKIEPTSLITNTSTTSLSPAELTGTSPKSANIVNVWSPLHTERVHCKSEHAILNTSPTGPDLSNCSSNKAIPSTFIGASSTLPASYYCNIKKEPKQLNVSNLIPISDLTGQGNPSSSAISIGFASSGFLKRIAFAVDIPKSLKKLLHAHLLKVKLEANELELIYGSLIISKYDCSLPSSPGVP